jgi:hypothetical protein
MTILPRQARDKQKENSKRDACSYSQLKIPLCSVVGVSIPQQPRFATVLAPEWLGVIGKSNLTDPTYCETSLNSSTRVPTGSGPVEGSGEPRLLRTFASVSDDNTGRYGRWEICK